MKKIGKLLAMMFMVSFMFASALAMNPSVIVLHYSGSGLISLTGDGNNLIYTDPTTRPIVGVSQDSWKFYKFKRPDLIPVPAPNYYVQYFDGEVNTIEYGYQVNTVSSMTYPVMSHLVNVSGWYTGDTRYYGDIDSGEPFTLYGDVKVRLRFLEGAYNNATSGPGGVTVTSVAVVISDMSGTHVVPLSIPNGTTNITFTITVGPWGYWVN